MSTVVNCFVFITGTQGTCKFQFEKSRQIPLELWARGRDSIHFHGKIEGNGVSWRPRKILISAGSTMRWMADTIGLEVLPRFSYDFSNFWPTLWDPRGYRSKVGNAVESPMTEHRHFSFNCRRTKEERNRYLLLLRNCFLYAVFTLTR